MASEDEVECMVCMDTAHPSQAISCQYAHIYCVPCFNQHVKMQCDSEVNPLDQMVEREGLVFCAEANGLNPCQSDPFSDQYLSQLLDPPVYAGLMQARKRMMDYKIRQEVW